MPKYQDIRLCVSCLLLGGMLLSGGAYSHAQARRKGRAVPVVPRVDVGELVSKFRQQYAGYQFAEAHKSLEQLSKASTADSLFNLSLSRERLERAERMLPKAEGLTLLYKVSGDWGDIREYLRKYYATLHTRVRIEFNEHNGTMYCFCDLLRADSHYFATYSRTKGDISLYDFRDEDNSKQLEAINRADSEEDYPFVLSDGVRLIFGSNRTEGLGGYDLYMSRYNIERGAFLEPSLLPMPYNSPANDYLMVCDEELGRTLLVSDRESKKEGEVTLFVFEGLPDFVTAKKTSEINELSEEHIAHALLRQEPQLKEDSSLIVNREAEPKPVFIPLKAGEVICSWDDFRTDEAKELYKAYLEGERDMERFVWGQKHVLENMRLGKLTTEQAKAEYIKAARGLRELSKEQNQRLIKIKNIEIKERNKQ